MIDMRGMKRSLKLAEWARLIGQRAESGKTINDWCEEQGIPRRIYHYWQNRVCEEVLRNICLNQEGIPGIVPVKNPSSSEAAMILPNAPSFVKVPLGSLPQTETTETEDTTGITMRVRIGGAECEIFDCADSNVVERVLLTLGQL